MISHNKNFIFIHIPKTGGTSIMLALREYTEDRIYQSKPKNNYEIENKELGNYKHFGLDEYQESMGNDVLNQYYFFTVIRNPYDRFVSEYFHMKRLNKKKGETIQFDEEEFKEMLRSEALRSMNSYLLPRDRDEHFSFRALRFENLKLDFDNLCFDRGWQKRRLYHKNKGQHKDYRDYYSKETEEIVYEKFKEDFNIFNYERLI